MQKNNWKKCKLSEVCEITSSKRIFMADYVKSGVPFFRSKEIIEKANGNEISTPLFISLNKFAEIKKKYGVPQPNDLLLTSVGTLGIPYQVKEDDHFYFKDGNLTWFRHFSHILPKYLYYFFKSSMGRNILDEISIGSTQKALTITALQNISLYLPPLEEQKRIAEVLGAFDDKIELLQKQNKTLEEMAKATFKSWFVDFIPFGGIRPTDWKEISLADIANFVSGYSYKGDELKLSTMAMATIKNFGRNGEFKLDGFKEIMPSSKLKLSQKVNLFETIVAHTDLTQNADVIGNAALLLSKGNYKEIIISMDVVKVLPKNDLISTFIIAALLKTKHFKNHCLGYINGTTVLHLSKKALPEYRFYFPQNIQILNSLSESLGNFYKKMSFNMEQIQTLTELRDSLLPRLLSGKIRV